MEGNKNGNTVLLTVIGVATLLVALVGATFAYFTANITTTNQQTVSVSTKTVAALVYNSNGAITLLNTVPGNQATQTFTVTNEDTSIAQSYDLDLVVDGNTFVATDGAGQLLVTITGESTTAGTKTTYASNGTTSTSTASNTPSIVAGWTDRDYTAGKTNKENIVSDQRIEAGEVQTYTVLVKFVELGDSQNTNQSKSFSAHIEASDPKSLNA